MSGLNWVVDPVEAAKSLELMLPDGMARSTVIGDMGSFFLGLATLVLLGAITLRAHWLQAAAMFFGLAAIMRTLAWAMHGAGFAAAFIAIEVVVAAFLLFASTRAE